MPLRRWLLLAFGGLAAVYLIGLLFGSPLLPSAGLLAWAALCGYAVLAGRRAPRPVLAALAAGLLTLAVLAGIELLSARGTPVDYGFLSYSPAPPPDVLALLRDGVREIAPLLLAYGCLAVAVFALPGRRRTQAGTVVAVAGTVCAAGYAALELWSRADGPGEWLRYSAALAPPLALAVAAFGAAGAAVARGGRAVAGAGMALIGLAAMSLFDSAIGAAWSRPDDADVAVVLAVVVTGPGTTVTTDWAVVAALQLAGAAAVTVGCLRARRPSPN